MVVVKVVLGHEHGPQHFSATVQMMQVTAREVRTGVTVTRRIHRLVRVSMLGIANLQRAVAGKEIAVARIARGHDTVEHVYAQGPGPVAYRRP